MVQITHLRTIVDTRAGIERLRAEFDERHCVVLPQLLEPGLLRSIQEGLERSEFYERTHKGIGAELCLTASATAASLNFLANDAALFQIVRQITGCGRIGCFDGRVYRMVPGMDHFDSWHSDASKDRMVAMSINLSSATYRGGVLQIREADSQRLLTEVANVGCGDAVLFRIASHLQHRVTALEGTVARTAYAGWFRSQPDFQELLGRLLSPQRLEAVS